VDVLLVGAWDRQPHRLSTRRQQQAVVGNGAATCKYDIARFRIDRDNLGVKAHIDAGIDIEIVRAQR
jgi:hypothetical protein